MMRFPELVAPARFAARRAATILALLAASPLPLPAGMQAQRRAGAAALATADVGRWARLLALVDTRALDTAVVDDALGGGSRVRARAALAIGQVGMRARYEVLRRLAGEADTAVAANAAFALGLVRDTSAVEALGALLDRPDGAGLEAAWALGRIGEPARATLVAATGRRAGRPAPTSAAILVALGRLRPVPVDAIVPFIGAADRDVAWAAAYAVARNRAAGGVRPLMARVASPDAPERANVALALQKPTAGDSLADSARLLLRGLARDAHPHVRVNAARALASWGALERDAVLALARDRDASVRIAVRQSLRGVIDRGDTAWRALWSADTTLAARRAVAAAAVGAGAELPAFEEWARSPRWQHRHALAEAYGASPTAEGRLTRLERWSEEPDGRVRTALVGMIEGALDSAAVAGRAGAKLLEYVARDADPFVRAGALGALLRVATPAELPIVLASYRAHVADRDNDAAIAAMRVLAAAWRRDSTSWPDSLRAAVAGTARPRDPLVREAARGLGLVAWAGDGRDSMPTTFGRYEALVRRYVVPTLAERAPRLGIATVRGTIVLELFAEEAPMTVDNMLGLAGRRYFDGLAFHRVVPNFVAQDGDPRGDGNGGPGWAIRDEHNRNRYARGVLGMALSGPHTGGSQWFITHSPQPHLDGDYTVFGRIVSGWAALDALVQGDRILRIRASGAAAR